MENAHMQCRQFLVAAVLVVATNNCASLAGEPKSLTVDQFEKLHRMLKPQAGESRWMEIDWHPSVWEARQKAAAEGKPIFIMAGSGGAPPAGC
jgi:hypothetical protein